MVNGTSPARGEADALAQRGSSLFYWVAGLTLVNTLIALAGMNRHFLFGLGTTEILDIAAQSTSSIVKAVSVTISVLIIGSVAAFGYAASRHKKWAYIIGLILYGIDLAICLLIQDWLSALFHLWVGYGILNGYKALRQLDQIAAMEAAQGQFGYGAAPGQSPAGAWPPPPGSPVPAQAPGQWVDPLSVPQQQWPAQPVPQQAAQPQWPNPQPAQSQWPGQSPVQQPAQPQWPNPAPAQPQWPGQQPPADQ